MIRLSSSGYGDSEFSQKQEDLRAQGLIRTSISEWFYLKLLSVKSFQRTSVKISGLEYQNSSLAVSYQSRIKTLPPPSHFFCPPLMSDEYRGTFEEIFPSSMGSHQKNCESQLSFRVQKPYEAQFSFETWGHFNTKTQNPFMHAHSDGFWEMKGQCGWACGSITA